MRVALVAPSCAPSTGGLERHVDRLARGLAADGVRVEVLMQESTRHAPRISELDSGVLVRRFALPIGNDRAPVAPGLWEHVHRRGRSYDLVHVHSRRASLPFAMARACKRPLVFTPHAPVPLVLRWPYARIARTLLHKVAATAATSRAEADLIRRRFAWMAGRVHAIPSGVDAAEITAAEVRSDSHDVVVTVGRLERHKRFDRTIAAMAGCPSELELIVIGEGSARRTLQAHAADLRVASRVHFLGRVPDRELYGWLRTARVVASVPLLEGSGAPVMEALSAGATVVASDIPVHREVASRAPTAPVCFVPPECSPLQLADTIADALGTRAPAPTEATLPNWQTVVDMTCALYEAVLRAASRAGGAPGGPATTKGRVNGRDPSPHVGIEG